MGRRVGFDVHLHDGTIGTNQHGQAAGAFLISGLGRTIRQRNSAIGITQEIRCKAGLIPPSFQIRRCTEGYAEQNCVLVFEFRGSITEPLGFTGSPTAKRAWEKPDQDILSRIIGKTDDLSILIRQCKRRWSASCCWHRHGILVQVFKGTRCLAQTVPAMPKKGSQCCSVRLVHLSKSRNPKIGGY